MFILCTKHITNKNVSQVVVHKEIPTSGSVGTSMKKSRNKRGYVCIRIADSLTVQIVALFERWRAASHSGNLYQIGLDT